MFELIFVWTDPSVDLRTKIESNLMCIILFSVTIGIFSSIKKAKKLEKQINTMEVSLCNDCFISSDSRNDPNDLPMENLPSLKSQIRSEIKLEILRAESEQLMSIHKTSAIGLFYFHFLYPFWVAVVPYLVALFQGKDVEDVDPNVKYLGIIPAMLITGRVTYLDDGQWL